MASPGSMAGGSGWAAVTYETWPWESTYDAGLGSRRERARQRGPYRAAVVPHIAAARPTIASEVAAEADDASTEIARFDAELGRDLAPFSAILLRSESAASSQIENLTASARAIAEAELVPDHAGNAGRIVANTRAMRAAVELADRLDKDAVLEMHAALMESHAPTMAGRWRQEQVWIGRGRLGPHEADFVPPHPSRVENDVADLVDFMARDDLPVLTHVALAHAQFETIHPFPDGNGRTGRALIHALLRAKGLTRSVTVPVSAGLLTDVDAYFDALTRYRQGDLEPIIRRLTAASFEAVANGRRLVADLTDIREGWQDVVRARRGSGTWKVADLFLRQPVVSAALVARELGIHPNNVYRLIAPLAAAGLVRETTARSRDRIWRSPEVLSALDDFAARAGRRSAPTP